jgi:predicted cupin superfamily sugar epimerase
MPPTKGADATWLHALPKVENVENVLTLYHLVLFSSLGIWHRNVSRKTWHERRHDDIQASLDCHHGVHADTVVQHVAHVVLCRGMVWFWAKKLEG